MFPKNPLSRRNRNNPSPGPKTVAAGSHRTRFALFPLGFWQPTPLAEAPHTHQPITTSPTSSKAKHPTDPTQHTKCPTCGATPKTPTLAPHAPEPIPPIPSPSPSPLLLAQRARDAELSRLETDLRSANFLPSTVPRDGAAYAAAVRDFVVRHLGRYAIYETVQGVKLAEGRAASEGGVRWEGQGEGGGGAGRWVGR